MDLREIIRKASGETLDLKPYEADMRHLIDTYIQADEPRKISPFDGLGLLDLIVRSGIAATIADELGGLKGNRYAVAETIENNVRSKIIKESLTDPAYFARMSALLDEIIRLRREKAVEYEDYLKRIAELAARVHQGNAGDLPARLDTLGKRALYNNLKDFVPAQALAEQPAGYGETEPTLALVLRLDEAVRQHRQDGWRGSVPKETAPTVELGHSSLLLQVRPGCEAARRQEILDAWHREQIRQAVPALLEKWQPLIGVRAGKIFVQRMRTRWGSCNPTSGHLRLNTDLAKKPPECLEYIVVHELTHLLEPTHNARFASLMEGFLPHWRQVRDELNRLPVRHEDWLY